MIDRVLVHIETGEPASIGEILVGPWGDRMELRGVDFDSITVQYPGGPRMDFKHFPSAYGLKWKVL